MKNFTWKVKSEAEKAAEAHTRAEQVPHVVLVHMHCVYNTLRATIYDEDILVFDNLSPKVF